MEIDKNVLNQALSADPERIEALARGIAQIMGIPAEKALAVAGNSALIQSRLAAMSEQDLQRFVSQLGEERAAQIMALIRGGNG